MRLDKKDKEILFELSKNSRQPFSVIAKKIKLSRETCTYKVHRMEDEGIISNYLTLVSVSKLGLNLYKIYLQLHGASKETFDSMINDFVAYPKINWVAKCVGSFDAIIAILCKDAKEFNKEKNMILQKYNEYISNYYVGQMADTYIYGKNYLVDNEITSIENIKMIGEEKIVNLDDTDKEILCLLANNSRLPLMDIAKELDLNIKTVISRVKILEKTIITGYDVFFDFNKLNYKYYKLFISINKFKSKEYNDFIAYCKNNRNIVYLVENIGSWELEPEIEIDSEEKFYEIVDNIKNKFPEFIKKIEIVRITNDYKHIYVPKEIINNL
jgi:DNA-binding Lrp family transcriptional regulator